MRWSDLEVEGTFTLSDPASHHEEPNMGRFRLSYRGQSEWKTKTLHSPLLFIILFLSLYRIISSRL